MCLLIYVGACICWYVYMYMLVHVYVGIRLYMYMLLRIRIHVVCVDTYEEIGGRGKLTKFMTPCIRISPSF